jgi:hypothetical protein
MKLGLDMLKWSTIKKQLIAVMGFGLFALNTMATPVTLSGLNFDLIYDDSLEGLFNTPTLIGNTVFFTPVNFFAQSLNGAGFSTANSTINLKIIPNNNLTISQLNLTERGDYQLMGANSFVTVAGQTRVFDVNNPFQEITNSIVSNSNLALNDGATHNWQSSSMLDLTSNEWSDKDINYTIENLLRAYTESKDVGPKLAFIEKKFVGSSISLVVSTIPEPQNSTMLLGGLGVLAVVMRRKLTV